MFKVRRTLAIAGGSATFGSDCNIYRSTTNTLKTDDNFLIGGTSFGAPYSTSTPTPLTNGNLNVHHKGNLPGLSIRAGGTTYCIQFPTTTHGTPTFHAGSAF